MRHYGLSVLCAFLSGFLLTALPCGAEEQTRTARDAYEDSFHRLPVDPRHLPQGDPQFSDPQCYSVSDRGGNKVITAKPVNFIPDPSNEFRRLACDCQLRVIGTWQRYLSVLSARVPRADRERHAKWIAEDALKFFCSPYEIFKKCLLTEQDKNRQQNCLDNYAGSTSGFVFDVLLGKYSVSKSQQR